MTPPRRGRAAMRVQSGDRVTQLANSNQIKTLRLLQNNAVIDILSRTKIADGCTSALLKEGKVPLSNQIVPHFDDGFQSFDFNGISIRGKLDDNGDPIILADSVCEGLGLTNVSKSLAGLPENEKGITESYTPGGWQNVAYVTEQGLYRLIYRSNKPQAENFRQKLFGEILPTLRKTGFYASRDLSSLDVLKQMVTVLDRQERELKEVRQLQAQQAIQIEDIHEELLDRDYYTILQWCQKQHIAHTPSLRQMWGKEAKALSSANNVEIKDTTEGLYTVGRYHKLILKDVCVPKPRTNGQMHLIGDGK